MIHSLLPMWNLGGLSWRELLRRTWRQFWADQILDQSAKLSFFLLLALLPLLVFLVSLLGLVLQAGPLLQRTLHDYLTALVPAIASGLIDATLQEIIQDSDSVKLSLGLIIGLGLAAQGMIATIGALNVAYEVQETRPLWKRLLLAFGLILVFLVQISAGLLLMIYGGRASQIFINHFGLSPKFALAWQLIQWPLTLIFPLMSFNLLYFYAPNVQRRRWHWLMPGTLLGVFLWLSASFGFKLYLNVVGRFTLAYGTIGTVIILVSWFYLSSTAILIGGEVNSEIEKASATTLPKTEARKGNPIGLNSLNV